MRGERGVRGGEREIGKETYKIFHEGENRFLRQQSAPVKGRKHQMPTVSPREEKEYTAREGTGEGTITCAR